MFLPSIWFLVGERNSGHFFSYLLKLEIGVVFILRGVEDSFGFIIIILLVGVVEGAVGLRVLVSLSRSSGRDRLRLGLLVNQNKY